MLVRWTVRVAAALVVAVVGAELVGALVGRAAPRPASGARIVVVVLGHPSRRDGRPTGRQRRRCRLGARTLAAAGDGIVVCTGGATRGRPEPEADVLARVLVEELGVPDHLVRREPLATTTWENVGWSLAHVGPGDQVAFASEPLHAARARRYARHRRPDLADRLVVADHRRVQDRWLAAWSVPYEAWCWLLDAAAARRGATSPTGWTPEG